MGKKRYNQKDGVGKSKYVISYHDGKKKHKDGSDFFDIQIFRNKKDLAKFVNSLHKGGYKYGFGESINEASKLAMGIAGFTGTRGSAVDDFINTHNIDAKKLFNFVKKGNLKDRMAFVSAIAGRPNNKMFKMITKQFGESVNEERLNLRDLPSYVSEDPGDFEDWYDDGMELTKKGKKLAPFSKSDERKLFNIVQMWQDAEGDKMFGGTSSSDVKGYIKDIEKFLKQKGKVVSESVNEDTDVGHQDDEPNMLKSTALEIMEYGKKLMDKLDKYDDMEGEVDFPNWWQSKLTLARDYVSKAYHYLDSEEKTSETIDRSFRTYRDDEGDDEGPVDEAFVVAYGKGPKPIKPAFAAYADKKMAQKFMADMKKDGYKVMMTQKKIRGIDESNLNECWDTHKQVGFKMKNGKRVPNCVPKNEIKEDKNQIVQLKKKVGKSEIKFYDALSKIEKKLGKKKYRAFLEKGLKDFKVNAKHYDYRSNGAAEEKLFQLAK